MTFTVSEACVVFRLSESEVNCKYICIALVSIPSVVSQGV